jgi:SAM-dependent methyltransferase
MQILDVIRDLIPPAPWTHGDNIPWNEPGFSERMLREHLSPDHDLASRRQGTIDRQVAWIHEHVLRARSTRILDLGCGPGLYGGRLAKCGHQYIGIDYSPASIAYAARESARSSQCTFIEGDIRHVDYGCGYGLVMMVYGEFNVFRPADIGSILSKVYAALEPGGLILLEPHSREAVVSIGEGGRTWEALDSGLFSDRPHLILQQAHWDEASQAATREFFVIDAATGDVARYAVSYQAYSDAEYRTLLTDQGFGDIAFCPSLTGEPDPTTPNFVAILGKKPNGDSRQSQP